jgi:hypothetical protein
MLDCLLESEIVSLQANGLAGPVASDFGNRVSLNLDSTLNSA